MLCILLIALVRSEYQSKTLHPLPQFLIGPLKTQTHTRLSFSELMLSSPPSIAAASLPPSQPLTRPSINLWPLPSRLVYASSPPSGRRSDGAPLDCQRDTHQRPATRHLSGAEGEEGALRRNKRRPGRLAEPSLRLCRLISKPMNFRLT